MAATSSGFWVDAYCWIGNCKRPVEERFMNSNRIARTAAKWVATGFGFAAASYATYVGLTWLRYGKPQQPHGKSSDEHLDLFMPKYDVADRHTIWVVAPADAK